MSKDDLLIRYVGFRARLRLREYMFQVRRTGADTIEFRLTIPNDAFDSHRIRYQDGPGMCCEWIHRELASSAVAGNTPRTRWKMSEQELDDYRVAHAPAPRRGMMYKPPVESF